MRTSHRHDLLRWRSFGICRQANWGMTSEAKSSRVSTSFRSPLISGSMPAPRYCRIRSICWMLDMQTKFVEANGLRFEVLEQGTGVRLALCLHGFPEHAISWRHQIPVLAGMGYRVWAVNQRGYGRTTRPTQVADYALRHLVDDVTALIDAARAKNVVLIGHDWGRWSLGALPPSNAARCIG